MSEIIDRAAKAMQESRAWPVVFKAGAAEELARAALASTREPTPEMISAGAKKVRGGSSRDCAAAVWRAMHDVIMKE